MTATARPWFGPVQAARTLQVFYWILLALTALLLASGVYLVFNYRPVASAAFSDISQLQDARFMRAIVSIHSITPWLWFVAASIVAGLELSQRSYRRGSVLVVSIVAAVGAFITGLLLPWDQVALWAVTVGSNIVGYTLFFTDDNVRFVLIDGSEVSTATIRVWVAVHVCLGGLVMLTTTAGVFVRRKGRSETHP